jgi:hypothetical protein
VCPVHLCGHLLRGFQRSVRAVDARRNCRIISLCRHPRSRPRSHALSISTLTYYVEDGFEAEVTSLGAQKQVAGGGRYAEGIGWAIGVDRLMLALQTQATAR